MPLDRLEIDTLNVRDDKKGETGIAELAENIRANGLVQWLVVRPDTTKNAKLKKNQHPFYLVTAGGRRLRALRLLADQGHIAANTPIDCAERSQAQVANATAVEVSLAENMERLPMSPTEQFYAFANLHSGGRTVLEIATRFATTERIVQQRLKLAQVHPKLLTLLDEGQLSLKTVEAYTLCKDQDEQAAIFDSLPEYQRDNAHLVRHALGREKLATDSNLVSYVTVEAYEKAGGTITRDLFDAEDGGLCDNAALVVKLAVAKLEDEAEAIRETEGWGFVIWSLERDYDLLGRYKQAFPPEPTLTEKQQERADEQEDLVEEAYYEDWSTERAEKTAKLEAELEILTTGTFTTEDRKTMGIICYLAGSALQVKRNLIDPEAETADNQQDPDQSEATEPTGPKPLSAALIEDLTAQRSYALRTELAKNPHTALVALTHAMALKILYTGYMRKDDETCLVQSVNIVQRRQSIEDHDDNRATIAFEAVLDEWRTKVPEDYTKLWQWCLDQTTQTLLALQAVCTSATLDCTLTKMDSPDIARYRQADHIDQIVGLDMADHWTGHQRYFERLSKDHICAAITEMLGEADIQTTHNSKKGELVARATALAERDGYLPEVLRAPSIEQNENPDIAQAA